MNRDADLIAVREVVAPRTTGTEPALARCWTIIEAGRLPDRRLARLAGPVRLPGPTRAARPARGVRWLVPVGVAVTVLALAVGVAVLAVPRGAGPDLQPGTRAPVLLPAPDGLGQATPLPPAEVLAVMTAAAADAEPAQPAEGQLIYLHSAGERTSYGFPLVEASEHWLWPDGMVELAAWIGTDPAGHSDPGEIRRSGSIPGTVVPRFERPTPAWLAGLPTDPDDLLPLLVEDGSRIAGPGAGLSEGRRVVEAVGELFSRAELIIPVPLRIAIYEVLIGLPGIATGEIDHEGRQLFVVSHTEGDQFLNLYLDPATGRVSGGAGTTDPETGDHGYQLWSYAIVDEIGETG